VILRGSDCDEGVVDRVGVGVDDDSVGAGTDVVDVEEIVVDTDGNEVGVVEIVEEAEEGSEGEAEWRMDKA
jgi:hypothetical protein